MVNTPLILIPKKSISTIYGLPMLFQTSPPVNIMLSFTHVLSLDHKLTTEEFEVTSFYVKKRIDLSEARLRHLEPSVPRKKEG